MNGGSSQGAADADGTVKAAVGVAVPAVGEGHELLAALVHGAILTRRAAGPALEGMAEIRRVAVAQVFGNRLGGHAGIEQVANRQLLAHVHQQCVVGGAEGIQSPAQGTG